MKRAAVQQSELREPSIPARAARVHGQPGKAPSWRRTLRRSEQAVASSFSLIERSRRLLDEVERALTRCERPRRICRRMLGFWECLSEASRHLERSISGIAQTTARIAARPQGAPEATELLLRNTLAFLAASSQVEGLTGRADGLDERLFLRDAAGRIESLVPHSPEAIARAHSVASRLDAIDDLPSEPPSFLRIRSRWQRSAPLAATESIKRPSRGRAPPTLGERAPRSHPLTRRSGR